MVGVDLHDTLPPPGTAPPTPTPHMCGSILMGIGLFATWSDSVITDSWGWTMIRGTEIGSLIPHFSGPNLLLWLHWAMSGSKSHFGASTVRVQNKGPIACALFFSINPNLNCHGPATSPFPRPTGFVFAPTTHLAGMTWGDIIMGFLSMGVDCLIEGLMNRFFASRFATRIMDRIGKAAFSRYLAGVFFRNPQAYQQLLRQGTDAYWRGVGRQISNNLFGTNSNYILTRAIPQGAYGGPAIVDGLFRTVTPCAAGLLFGSPVGGAQPYSAGTAYADGTQQGYMAGVDSINNAVYDDPPPTRIYPEGN